MKILMSPELGGEIIALFDGDPNGQHDTRVTGVITGRTAETFTVVDEPAISQADLSLCFLYLFISADYALTGEEIRLLVAEQVSATKVVANYFGAGAKLRFSDNTVYRVNGKEKANVHNTRKNL